MFQLTLADAGMVMQMPEHRAEVEAAVAKDPELAEWKNSCSKKPEYNVGLVDLLCNQPG